MKNLNGNCYNLPFSHIYVERDVLEHPRTGKILSQFPHAEMVVIDHYKDVFCRSGQDYVQQHRSQNLILAAKHGTLLYEGAPVCQSFGNEYFYYTSCAMNCVYDCEYCYLKGMYPSGNLVIFVNLEDIFADVEEIIKKHPVYLCVSYDTDLLAMEHMTGYVAEWAYFVKKQNEREPGRLKIELRTKCANREIWQKLPAENGMICAFTLSPQSVITAYEHRTPSLEQRLCSAAEAMRAGFPVRLCFDPMIYCREWRSQYDAMLEQVFKLSDRDYIVDVSVGTFRVSQDYLKKMRRSQPDSAVVQFPFQNDGGVYHYPAELMEEMEQYLVTRLSEWIPEQKIFRWQSGEKPVDDVSR